MRGGVNLPTRRLAVACQPCPDKSANIETWELERDLGALSCSVRRAGKGRPRACGVTRLRLCTSHVAPRRKQNTVLKARLLGEICAAHSSLLVHLQMNMPQTNALCIPASRMQAHVLSGSPSSPPSMVPIESASAERDARRRRRPGCQGGSSAAPGVHCRRRHPFARPPIARSRPRIESQRSDFSVHQRDGGNGAPPRCCFVQVRGAGADSPKHCNRKEGSEIRVVIGEDRPSETVGVLRRRRQMRSDGSHQTLQLSTMLSTCTLRNTTRPGSC